MPKDIAYDSRIKLQRALQHFRELSEQIRSFGASDFYTISAEREPSSGQPVIRVVIQPLPSSIPAIIGDIVHNLRSSLDILWNTMIRRIGGSDRRAYFPFYKDREDVDRRISTDLVQAVPGLRDTLLDDIRPYEKSDRVLWTLNKLSNVDKHRLLIPSVHATLFKSMLAFDNGNNLFVHPPQVFTVGTTIFRAGWLYDIEVVSYGKASLEVFFDVPPIAGAPVIQHLSLMGKETKSAINSIRAAWVASGHE